MLAVMMIGLFLGAYLPNRRTAAIVSTIIFVASYFAKAMADLVESLNFMRKFSLFNYFDTTTTIFTEGPKVNDMLVLLLIAAVFFVLALLSFQRRNITVGAWPWQRAGA